MLRVVESNDGVHSNALTPESSTSSDQNVCYSFKNSSASAETKEPVKFPHIIKNPHEVPPTAGLEEHNEEDEQGYSSSEAESPQKGFNSKLDWIEIESCRSNSQPLCSSLNNVLQECTADSTPPPSPSPKERVCKKKKRQSIMRHRPATNSGVTESLEDRHSDFSLTEW